MKETHDNMFAVQNTIKCKDFKWRIGGDLKVISILMGPLCRTKSCFLCSLNSRETQKHFMKKFCRREKHLVRPHSRSKISTSYTSTHRVGIDEEFCQGHG